MNINLTKKLIRPIIHPLVLVLALAGVPAVALASASTSTAATCATTTARWGSLAKVFRPMSEGPISGIRAGRQTCFDRMVIDLRGRSAGYRVRYVSQVRTDGQGALIPLRGGARLEIITSRADDVNTGVAYTPRNQRELAKVTGFTTFRQIAWGGSFEGQSTIGLGVRSRLPMRAFIVNGPGAGSRVVIDVAHRW